MKNFTILLMVGLLAFAMSCSNDKSSNLGPSPQPINPNVPSAAPSAPAAPSAQGVAVQHYICPNNCANSGGPTAGTCPVCGSTYLHNAAYHSQPGAANNSAANAVPQTPSAAQNAAGVYHYTCPNGHAGGAGTAQPCAVCGTTLVHNQAFHATGNTGSTTVTPSAGQKSPLFIDGNNNN